MGLRRGMAVVRARSKLVATTFACSVALAALYVAITPSTYTAQSFVLLDPRQTRVTDSDVLQGMGADAGAIASQVEVMRSPALLSKVYKNEGLADDPEFHRVGLLRRLLGGGGARPDAPDAGFEDFRKRVTAQRQGATYVIEVGFTAADPQKAARLANAVVKGYLNNEVAERAQANSEVSTFLDRQITALREKLDAAENALEAFKFKNGIVTLGDGRTLIRAEIDKFSVQLLNAREQARLAESRYQQALKLGASDAALAEIQKTASSRGIDALRTAYLQREVEFARIQMDYGPRHPAYVAAASELARAKGLIRVEIGRHVAQLRAERDLAKTNLAKAEAEMAAMQTRIGESDQTLVQMRQLERDVDASSKVLEQFLRRTREIGEPDQAQSAKARVLGVAIPPEGATWPKSGLILSSAMLYGLAFGIGLALYLGMPDPRRGRRSGARRSESVDEGARRKAA